ncbi:peptide ABC transporter substrate-binding protein [Clostridium rectalis]|uniref:peptide ABC transporter substrate-binding protein n=1 Tax=Clostridium rectalis TaxID=2040295 RepID=UPI001FAA97C4|nr:peptide ABC transporter substrate-binding protein [Clostridium rectalis]
MKSKKILAVLLTATMLISTALLGCGGKDKSGAGSGGSDKGQFINAVTATIRTLDSGKATDEASFCAVGQSFEGLLRYNEEKQENAGAEKVDVSEDKKTYTFTLRDNTWSDGKKVTAKDYEYAWKRLINPDTKASYASFLFPVKNAENYYGGKAKIEDVGIKAVDDKTLKVELEAPTPYFLGLVSFPALSPLRQDIVEKLGDKYGSDPSQMVFNGPFVVGKWQRGAKMELKKNDKYWDAKNIQLSNVNLVDIKEMPTRYQMFEKKEVDVTAATGEYVEKFKKYSESGKADYVEGIMPTSFYMEMNVAGKNKILTNAKVRRALSLAMDRDNYVKNVYKRGFVSYSLIPNGLHVGDKVFRDLAEEPLKKLVDEKKDPKALFIEGLKELGLNPDPSKYTVGYLPQGADTQERLYAEYFQNQWKSKIGVNVRIDAAADFSDYLDKLIKGNFEIAMSGWGADYADPDSFLTIFRSGDGNNHGKFSNKEYDQLLDKIRVEADFNKRVELIKQAENLLVVKEAALAPVFNKDRRMFVQKYVKGVQYPDFGGTFEFRWASAADRK